MEVGAGRDGADLAHDVVDESVGGIFVDTQSAPTNVCAGVKPRWTRAARELGISGEPGIDVTGHVNFRYDRDVTRPRVAHDVLIILLSVEAAGSASNLRQRAAVAAHLRLDLDG